MTSLYIRAALLLGLVLLLFLGLTSRPRAEGLVIRDERGQYLGRLETNPIRPGEKVIRDTRGLAIGTVEPDRIRGGSLLRDTRGHVVGRVGK